LGIVIGTALELIRTIKKHLSGIADQQTKKTLKGSTMLDIVIFMGMVLKRTGTKQYDCCNCLQIREMKKQEKN